MAVNWRRDQLQSKKKMAIKNQKKEQTWHDLETPT
jgi:hypothetical protein